MLSAGEQVVRRLGAAARVEDVVQAAGAAKGTFYVYFDTWDEFLLALRDRAFRQMDAKFAAFAQSCSDWPALIGGLPACFIDLTLSLEGLHPAVFHTSVAHAPVENPRFDILARLGRLFAGGMEDKALEVPDLAVTSRFVFGLLHEAADLVEQGGDRQHIELTLQTLLLNALNVQPVTLRHKEPNDVD